MFSIRRMDGAKARPEEPFKSSPESGHKAPLTPSEAGYSSISMFSIPESSSWLIWGWQSMGWVVALGDPRVGGTAEGASDPAPSVPQPSSTLTPIIAACAIADPVGIELLKEGEISDDSWPNHQPWLDVSYIH